MKSVLNRILATIVLLATTHFSYCQGTFVNLDFEHPIQPLNRDAFFMVPTSNAIPGWTAYVGGVTQTSIIYNTRPLDAAEVTLQGTNSDSITPIQGNFTVALFGASAFAPQQSAAVGQTGLIPMGTESLVFYSSSLGLQVTFGGQSIPLVQVGAGAGYIIVGGNISSFAGQTGELLFTAPPRTAGLLDAIQFSTSPIPEPGMLGLLALGGLLFGVSCRRRSTS